MPLFSSFLNKIILIIISTIVLILVIIVLFNTTKSNIEKISDEFLKGTVLNEFNSYVTILEGSNKLQVASIKTIDKFTKKDSKSILWDIIALPDVVVEVQVPVEYVFYIDLKKKWQFQFEKSDTSIFIIAPPIEYGTPALDISKMEIIVKKGSIFRDVEEIKENLRKELTEKLMKSADQKIPSVINIAKTETRNFFLTWFLKYYFKDVSLKPEKVIIEYANEKNIQKF